MDRGKIFPILFIFSFLICGIGLALFFRFPENTYIIFVPGIGIAFFIILLITYNVTKAKIDLESINRDVVAIHPQNRQSAFDAFNRRLEQAQEIALEKKNILSILKENSIDKYTRKLEQDDICMVCKLKLKDYDYILQCPICESLFHKEHLEEWLTIKKKCPVCSHNLKKKYE